MSVDSLKGPEGRLLKTYNFQAIGMLHQPQGKKKAVGSVLMSSGVASHQAPKKYWAFTSPSENTAK